MRWRGILLASLLAAALPAQAQIVINGSPPVTNTPGAVNSVSSSDGFVIVSPNTGNVSIHLASGLLTAANNLSDLNNAGTARTNLGLGSMATQGAGAVSITGGSVTGVTLSSGNATITGGAITGTTVSGITFSGSGTLNVGTGGTLGTAAFQNTGTSGATIPFLNGANTFSALQLVNLNAAAAQSAAAGTALQIYAADNVSTRLLMDSIGIQPTLNLRRADGTGGALSNVKNGEELGRLAVNGYNGIAFTGNVGDFRCFAAQDFSVGADGTKCQIDTVPNGSGTLTTGLTVDQDGSILGKAIGQTVNTNAALKAAANSRFPQGVWRLGVNTLNDAPPLFFRPQTGTCAANSFVSDVGGCNDTTAGDGNSWQSVHPNPTMVLVTQFGVWADNNAHDYSTQFQNCINYVSKTETTPGGFYGFGGNCFVPGGGGAQIALRSGVTTLNGVGIVGASRQASALCACTGDTTVVTLNGPLERLENLSIYGTNAPGLTANPLGPAITNLPNAGGTFSASNAALVLGSGATGYMVSNVDVWGGFYAIWNKAGDGRMWYVGAHGGYGDANVRNGVNGGAISGGQWDQLSFDQSPTGLTPPPAGTTINAWAANTMYPANTMVTIIQSGHGYIVESSNSGTSGNSSPGVCNFLVACVDNTVSWLLVNRSDNADIDVDGNSADLYISNADLTGPSVNAILLTTRGGGGGGNPFRCVSCLPSGTIGDAISITSGGDVMISNTNVGAPIQATAIGINEQSTFTGSLKLNGNNISAFNVALNIAGGASSQTVATGNTMANTSANNVVVVNENSAANAIVSNNILSSTSAAGSGVQITGNTSNSQISHNVCTGSLVPSLCISDVSSGSGNMVFGNTGGASTLGPLTVGASPATICAGSSYETHYLSQSATNTATVTIGGKAIGTMTAGTTVTSQLNPNQCEVVTWATTAPTYTRQIH